MIRIFIHSVFLILFSLINLDCGIALTTRATLKLPPQTKTEILRVNVIYGETDRMYGLNLGLANFVQKDLIGIQLGIVNGAEEGTGIQIGAINNSKPSFALLKIGIFNLNFFLDSGRPQPGDTPGSRDHRVKGDLSLSVGVANLASGKVNVGLFNYGYGFNTGLINWNGEGSAVSIGAVNIGETENFQIGILNFCKEGPIPFMIVANYCRSAPTENSSTNENTFVPETK
ncbi:LA_2272/LA_2273 family lipoprotein [Leptospira yasudae]|uniref:PPE family protein n=1 Tax=Leptospira yasudae TaxID=2202201 RepID=A0A6N4QSA7_9LEPT|nr:hypothetical protein [Leptospira yasudae]TGL76223.1 hypothetical protein EHQ72_13435 [Leptospira yasudae]TGL76661.1 hypothetical protein EHQ77_18170 [Leptospira yasudae]TGL90095.1 hypothetical protein EHQ83_00035 [Leptospira yasudae]